MKFKSYDSLRVFNIAAAHMSFTLAANQLNLSKGAISYQIKQLEEELGFTLFTRQHGGVVLTEKGNKLWQTSQLRFQQIDSAINQLKHQSYQQITIGMSTYFASRWLSPRLMNFTSVQADIGLRLQPMIDLIDLRSDEIDMAIRWGNGDWRDIIFEPLISCPAFVTGGEIISREIKQTEFSKVISKATLLHDTENSTAWRQWHEKANIPYSPKRTDLVIPDPNVRVQAVINNQGIALNDNLVSEELTIKKLFKISEIELTQYGYYVAYPDGALDNKALKTFRDWIVQTATNET